jgi:hypothetical protein
VLILKHYFASKSFAAVREAFSIAYPDKEVPNKTTIHRLVTVSGQRKCLYVFEKAMNIFCKAVL